MLLATVERVCIEDQPKNKINVSLLL